MRNLMTSTALALMLAGGAGLPVMAQDGSGTPAGNGETTESGQPSTKAMDDVASGDQAVLTTALPTDVHPVSEYYQQEVYDNKDNEIGDTNDLLIGPEGRISTVIIGVGGFLGVGEKNVAVPFEAISLQKDDDDDTHIIVNTTKQALQDAPGYTYDDDADRWVPAKDDARDDTAGDNDADDDKAGDDAN